jgi:hypothetical protein
MPVKGMKADETAATDPTYIRLASDADRAEEHTARSGFLRPA